MFGNDRNQLRKFYFDVWQKHQQQQALDGLEAMVVQVIQEHPEYHNMLADPNSHLERDWTPADGQTNPFLHMGMHISIQEQLSTQRPAGIMQIYQQLIGKLDSAHAAEHQMIECLGFVMWQAQATGHEPDMQAYLDCLKKLLS